MLTHLNSYAKLKSEAETICKLIDACFELLHVERTLAMFDQLIGDEDESNCSSSISVGKKTILINIFVRSKL